MMSGPPIIPVILCGGKGARLWPLSTPDKPKVFHCLTGDYSLFQETLLRCRSPVFANRPIVVGSAMHHALISNQLDAIGVTADILLEPCGRDSLPAALAGALMAHQRSSDAEVLLLASDHYIPDVDAFVESVVLARDIVGARVGVVFGVVPDGPSEAFGYVGLGSSLAGGIGFELSHFIEKPTRTVAQELVAAGWLWNSGNFLCKVEQFLKSAELLVPIELALVRKALQSQLIQEGTALLDVRYFGLLDRRSFDRALLERLTLGAVLPVRYKWRDLGSWDAIVALEAENVSPNLTGINHDRS